MDLGFPEIVRITSITLAAVNMGTLAGRIRLYVRLAYLARTKSPKDLWPQRAVLNFYFGLLLLLLSISWRNFQLFHHDVTVPLLISVLAQAWLLVGLSMMRKYVSVRIQGDVRGLRDFAKRNEP